jgi:SAM-dependent methyltransferase
MSDHDKTIDLMAHFAETYGLGGRVLDVGSLDINGSYRPLFKDYTGCDVVPGKNVDVVQPSQFDLPFLGSSFDTVISGQMLEHCENPFRITAEMVRVLKPGGMIALIAPWKMDYHAYPIDCWRISPDGFRCLFRDLDVETIFCAFADVYKPYEVGACFVGKKL